MRSIPHKLQELVAKIEAPEGKKSGETDAAGWAAAHLAWTTWAMARGAGPAIANPDAWLKDNRELFDGAACWLAQEGPLDLPVIDAVAVAQGGGA